MSTAENPYSSPGIAPQSAQSQAGPKRAAGLTPIGAIAIVIGAIGLFSFLGSLIDLLFGDQINSFTTAGMQPAQVEMQESILAIHRGFRLPKAILTAIHFVVSVLLIFGGISVIRRVSPSTLRIASWMGAALELLYFGLIIMLQIQTLPVIEKAMASIPGGFGGAFAKVSIIVGILFGGAWFLAKECFFFWTVYYLNKPHVKDNFPER